MNYSLRQLKVFVTVARARSFSRAGEMIGLSQSAVSHSVKELEHQTGVRLLDRTTREVVLTEAGQQLAGRLERLLDELTITLRDAGRVGQQLSGTVKVAASQTISAHLIPQCIAHSNRRYPDIDFVLHDRPQQWVLESIRQGEVDFGIVIDPGPAADLQCEVVLAEPFLLLCREDHPFASLTEVPWQALQDERLCVRQPPADRCGPQQTGYPGEHRPGDWPPGNAVSDGRIGNWHQRSAGAGATVTAGEPSDGETADSGDGAAADAGMQEKSLAVDRRSGVMGNCA